MSNLNGVIKAPVNISDVRGILGTNSGQVYDLCISDKIKMWAKHKPVSYPKVGVLTDSEFESIDYGLEPTVSPQSNPRYIEDAYWKYSPPTGGINSPYRLHDFDGYDHKALYPPIWGKETTFYPAFGGSVGLSVNPYAVQGDVNADNIKYSDLNSPRGSVSPTGLSNWYMCALYKDSAGYYHVKTSSESLAVAPMVNLTSDDVSSLGLSTVNYFLALSKNKHDTAIIFSQDADNEYLPALCSNPSEVQGKILVKTGTGITGGITGVASGRADSPAWLPNYERVIGPLPSPNPDGSYDSTVGFLAMSAIRSWTATLKITLKNGTDYARTMPRYNLSVQCFGNFNGVNSSAITVADGDLLDTSLASLSEITIPANGSIEFVVKLPSGFFIINSSGQQITPATGQKINPRIVLMYNGSSIASVYLRLSN